MSDLTTARRYATALNDETKQQGLTERVDADVDLIRESLAGSRELVHFFQSPIIPRDKKQAVIDRLFGERVHPLVLRFMHLIVSKERETLMPAIAEAYRDLRDEALNIVEAEARSALELTEAEREKLVNVLGSMTGKKIRLNVRTDPGLIGGLIVRVGDTVYDGSVRHQLSVLRERLEHGSHLNN